jgi:NADPH-dependent ferric siderophore reductase
LTISERTIRRVRHEPRLRLPEVIAVQRITPHMVKVSLGGADLDGFVSSGFDDHVKLFFPNPGEMRPILPNTPQSNQITVEGTLKPVARDYTPRRHDAVSRTLEIEFALHDSGPATAWAAQARPGHFLGVGGPRGSFIIPTDFACHLLVGDETALPAISRRLEELPPAVRAIVVVEVDTVAEEQGFATQAQAKIVWVHRLGAEPGSVRPLLDAVRALTLPTEDIFAWAACESGVARALRLHFLNERGFGKGRVKAAGYWKRGAAAVHDRLDD